MLEIKDGKKILTTPISSEDLADIHAGDIVYLNGSMTTCRDVAHRRLVEEGRELPVNVRDAAMISLKWYLLDRQPVCVWKNLNMNL